jgi:hypothetical protein
MSSIAAAVNRNKASAMPAAPVGNMEKNLCTAPTLTTSSDLDKREKGAQEATLLRGYEGLLENIFRWPEKQLAGSGGTEIKLPILPEEPAKALSAGAGPAFPLEEGDKS